MRGFKRGSLRLPLLNFLPDLSDRRPGNWMHAGCRRGSRRQLPVTPLIFLATSARTWIIATNSEAFFRILFSHSSRFRIPFFRVHIAQHRLTSFQHGAAAAARIIHIEDRTARKDANMRDPHAVRLFYEVGCEEGISYANPPPFTFSNDLGHFGLRGDELVVELVDHFPSERAARNAIEPFLRSWEIQSDLTHGIGSIRFKYLRVDITDRNPPPSGRTPIIRAVVDVVEFDDRVEAQVARNAYPDPPTNFCTTPNVERAYQRWCAYRASKEPLQGMAYFLLTLLERTAGNRKAAAKRFGIEFSILQTLGLLSSERGDDMTARKVPRSGKLRDLTPAERSWLEQAVLRIIRRIGEQASGATLPSISLADLPPLP